MTKFSEGTIVSGVVVAGTREAQRLGCPTANVQPADASALQKIRDGVYACDVIIETKQHKGMCYLNKERRDVLEAHIFDYSGDLYGQNIAVRLKEFVRPPVKNPSLDELRSLIKKDAEICCKRNP